MGVYHLNLWAHSLVELWVWGKPKGRICDRKASPGDDPGRRPSHPDRRKALRQACLRRQFFSPRHGRPLSRKFRTLVRALIKLVH